MRIALATLRGSPTDVRTWSGIPASVAAALAEVPGVEVAPLGPIAPATVLAGRALAASTRRAVHRRVNFEVEPWAVHRTSQALARAVRRAGPVDAVVTLGWSSTRPIPGLPWVYWGDATFAQRLETAGHWSGLSRRTRRHVGVQEVRLLASSTDVVMPSRWAADDVVVRYGIDPERVHQIPFGSNLDDERPPDRTAPRTERLRLLLVGVEWSRKGVDRAVLIADELRSRGVGAELDVVGVLPPDDSWERPHVRFHGFLRRDVPSEAERLRRLYDEAHLFLLPTRNDPFPVVLGEAAARGLPAVATRIGGVPERSPEGVTSVLVDPQAGIPEWAAAVETAVEPGRYEALSAGARRHHEQHASWGRSVRLLVDVIDRRRAALAEGRTA